MPDRSEFDRERWRDQASSEMALSYAGHAVERALEIEDMFERVARLIMVASTVRDTADYDVIDIDTEDIENSAVFTVGMLIEVGLDPDCLPVEALIDKAMRESLNSSALLEASKAARGEPIEMLYSPADGGIG
jgi:hypothetical protein